jgi:YD repeat-containing protein
MRCRTVLTSLASVLTVVAIYCNAAAGSRSSVHSKGGAQSPYTLTAVSPVAPGGQMSVSWTAPSGRPVKDWVALYVTGANNSTHLSWVYTQGATSGTFTPTAPATIGTYEFRYLLNDGYNSATVSNIVVVDVPPSISISSPTNNASFNALASINISVAASDSDGSVARVEFFQGSTKLGESYTSPFSFTWNNVAPGTYSLTAKATNDGGGAATSAAVNVSVVGGSTISGTVTQQDGSTPVVGATVTALLGTTGVGTATTNSSGNYGVSGLASGIYALQTSATGYLTQTQSGLAVSVGGTTTANVILGSASTAIGYAYDQLGRLISVTDPAAGTAVYSYDSVGNLLSISRYASTNVLVITFAPTSGPAGTVVSISGAGFSATPSQNAVTFNGVAATVTYSTATQIVATVPSGAGTGPIAVTSPTGSATSSTSFTVGSPPGSPSISGFTPAIGAPGASVTISGTNFNSTAYNNRVSFNPVRATVSSSTTTSISATVPVSGSGKISVATPAGSGVSSSDFFIPPVGYTATSVGFTGRVSLGSSIAVSVTNASPNALVVFDGVAGRQVSLRESNSSISVLSMAYYNPDGTNLLARQDMSPSNGNTSIGAVTLPLTGTYTILVTTSSAGSVTVSLYDCTPVVAAITPGGGPVSIANSVLAQSMILTFTASAGQRVSMITSNVNVCCGVIHGYLLKPDGSTLSNISIQSMITNFIDTQTLPVAGTYSILVAPGGSSTGSVSVTLYNVVDASGTLTIGGSPVTVTTTVPGQNASLTFSGAANQQATVHFTGNTIPASACVSVSLLKPDGTTLTSLSNQCGSSFNLASQTLPVTGTYTVFIDPAYTGTGSITVSVTSP